MILVCLWFRFNERARPLGQTRRTSGCVVRLWEKLFHKVWWFFVLCVRLVFAPFPGRCVPLGGMRALCFPPLFAWWMDWKSEVKINPRAAQRRAFLWELAALSQVCGSTLHKALVASANAGKQNIFFPFFRVPPSEKEPEIVLNLYHTTLAILSFWKWETFLLSFLYSLEKNFILMAFANALLAWWWKVPYEKALSIKNYFINPPDSF